MSKLSRDADVALNMVWKMCNDPNYNPTSYTILKIAKYLDVRVEDLFYEVEEVEDPGSLEEHPILSLLIIDLASRLEAMEARGLKRFLGRNPLVKLKLLRDFLSLIEQLKLKVKPG